MAAVADDRSGYSNGFQVLPSKTVAFFLLVAEGPT
jgi:hypothetical protein